MHLFYLYLYIPYFDSIRGLPQRTVFIRFNCFFLCALLFYSCHQKKFLYFSINGYWETKQHGTMNTVSLCVLVTCI